MRQILRLCLSVCPLTASRTLSLSVWLSISLSLSVGLSMHIIVHSTKLRQEFCVALSVCLITFCVVFLVIWPHKLDVVSDVADICFCLCVVSCTLCILYVLTSVGCSFSVQHLYIYPRLLKRSVGQFNPRLLKRFLGQLYPRPKCSVG